MSRIDVRDIDLDNLDDLTEDEFFKQKERVGKNDKIEDETRRDIHKKKSNLRRSRPE